MAGGGASRNLHLEVVEIEPALVEAQRGREALRRESVGEVERSDLELDGGGRRAQRRGGEFRLRPAGSRPARLGRPKRERQNAGHRQAVDGELAFDLRRRRRWRPRGSRPRAKRLLGAGDRGARLGDVLAPGEAKEHGSDKDRRIAERRFPAPVHLGGRACGWPSAAVQRWISDPDGYPIQIGSKR